jgi:anti-sigma factor RsiW
VVVVFWDMSPSANPNRCEQSEATCAYALQVLPASEVAAAEAHIASCPDCQRELVSLRPVVDRFVSWPTDVLRPTTSLQRRLALRIAEETGKRPVPPPARQWSEPDWEQVAPGIECKLLAADVERNRVSMLVRLARISHESFGIGRAESVKVVVRTIASADVGDPADGNRL